MRARPSKSERVSPTTSSSTSSSSTGAGADSSSFFSSSGSSALALCSEESGASVGSRVGQEGWKGGGEEESALLGFSGSFGGLFLGGTLGRGSGFGFSDLVLSGGGDGSGNFFRRHGRVRVWWEGEL